MGLFDDLSLSGLIGNAEKYVENQWAQRMVQVSVYAGLMFYLLSTGSIIEQVEKAVLNITNMKLGKDGTRGLHAVIFAVFMYYGSRFILDPLVKRIHLRQIMGNGGIEGMKNKPVQRKPVQRKPVQKKPVQGKPVQRNK